MPNTLVLESLHPFPGYHGHTSLKGPAPNSIYLVTDIKYEGEDILRAAKKVRRMLPYKFEAGFGKADVICKYLSFCQDHRSGLHRLYQVYPGWLSWMRE
jgi:hypothetical protein